MASKLLSRREWFVLYTRLQYTRRIAETIRKENGNCFLPMQTVSRKWSDRNKQTETPLFMNYIFVEATQEERIGYLDFEGSLRYVSSMGKPVVVRQKEMDKLMLLASPGAEARQENYLTAGDSVVVVNGIFAGMEGFLIKKTNGTRLLVRISLLKQAVSVEMGPQDLIGISEATAAGCLK